MTNDSSGGLRSAIGATGAALACFVPLAIYANLRGCYEFAVQNRTKGGSVFLTVDLPISALTNRKE